jgi:acyl dehydratase
VTQLAQGTWDDAAAWVGRVLAQVRGPDPVTAIDFRRQLEVMAFDCPLHTDEAVARAHGYETVPSPVSMTRTWSLPSYWEPGAARPGAEPMTAMIAVAQVPGVGDTILGTHVRGEHHEPLYPGDRVTATAVLRSVTPKTTRVGAGAFLVVETTFTNQRDAVLTVETATLFRFQRGQQAA